RRRRWRSCVPFRASDEPARGGRDDSRRERCGSRRGSGSVTLQGMLRPWIRCALLPLMLGWLQPAAARAWGAETHHYIAQHSSQHLPPEMDGLRVYDTVVDQHVNDPDIRRPTTPGEGPRHFIDIDRYSEFYAGTMPHDRAALEAIYGAQAVTDNGIVPWAVG